MTPLVIHNVEVVQGDMDMHVVACLESLIEFRNLPIDVEANTSSDAVENSVYGISCGIVRFLLVPVEVVVIHDAIVGAVYEVEAVVVVVVAIDECDSRKYQFLFFVGEDGLSEGSSPRFGFACE